jgi:hypothetical protein
MSSPTVVIFQPRNCGGGMSIAKLVLPQALGKAGRDVMFFPVWRFDPRMSMCSASQPCVFGEIEAHAQSEAFLAQQDVAAVTGADRDDGVVLREMTDPAPLGLRSSKRMDPAIEFASVFSPSFPRPPRPSRVMFRMLRTT